MKMQMKINKDWRKHALINFKLKFHCNNRETTDADISLDNFFTRSFFLFYFPIYLQKKSQVPKVNRKQIGNIQKKTTEFPILSGLQNDKEVIMNINRVSKVSGEDGTWTRTELNPIQSSNRACQLHHFPRRTICIDVLTLSHVDPYTQGALRSCLLVRTDGSCQWTLW